jgi:hypothetical protein
MFRAAFIMIVGVRLLGRKVHLAWPIGGVACAGIIRLLGRKRWNLFKESNLTDGTLPEVGISKWRKLSYIAANTDSITIVPLSADS